MSEVKRYAESLRGGVSESITGDWVSYEDYAALKAEREALAAESLALKEFGDTLNDIHNNLNGEGTGIQGRAEVACQQVALEAALEEFDAIQTPATDAHANQLRAEGVAMLRDEFKKHDEQFKVRCDWFISQLLRTPTAANLRKENGND